MFIRSLKPSLNCVFAGRTDKEYYNDNKEWISRRHQEFYNSNKETISQRLIQYYFDNQELMKQRCREYYESTRKTNIQQKVECECGCIVTRGSLIRHQRTKKHIELMRIYKPDDNEATVITE